MEKFNSRNVGATALALLTTLAGTPDALARGKAQEKPASPETLLAECETTLEATRNAVNAGLGEIVHLLDKIDDIKVPHHFPENPPTCAKLVIHASDVKTCVDQNGNSGENSGLVSCIENIKPIVFDCGTSQTEQQKLPGIELAFRLASIEDAPEKLDLCLDFLEEEKGEQAIVNTAKARLTAELARLKRAQAAEREQRTHDQTSRLKALRGNRDAR